MKSYDPAILVQLRLKTGLSQSALAEKLDCDRKTVLRWEKYGKTRDEHVTALLKLVEEAAPSTKPTPDPDEGIPAFILAPSIVRTEAEVREVQARRIAELQKEIDARLERESGRA